MGHEDLKSTQRYINVSENERETVRAPLNKMFRKNGNIFQS